MFLKPVKFVANHAYGLTLFGLFAIAAQGAVSVGLRNNSPSPQTKNMQAGALIVFNARNGEQIVLSNGPLAVGEGIREDADIRDSYKSLADLEKASFAIIDEKKSVNLSTVQIRESDIVDGKLISMFGFGALPQVCETESKCYPVATADLGNSSLASDAKREITRTLDQYQDLQDEYNQPETTGGQVWRKAQKEFYSIPGVSQVSDFFHNLRIG